MASTIWKGQLTFGLVSIPVRLHRAARRERVSMHYLKRTAAQAEPVEQELEEEEPYSPPETRSKAAHSFPLEALEEAPQSVTRVHQELVSRSDERPAGRQELVKGYQVAPEQYVTFSSEELRGLRLATSPDMQILRSVHLADIDPVYFETSYYVVPDRGGERPYGLLFTALQQTRYVALAKVAMHGREHVLVVRPGVKGLLAHTIYYKNEIRAEGEFETNLSEVAPKELELAKTFVEAIAGSFAPEEFKDGYREQVQKMVSNKLESNQVASSAPASSAQPAGAPVVNILDALKRSLDLAKKPVQKEGQPSRSKAQRKKA